MDIRKVQVTGGSSFVITLPKEWIKAMNIKKNNPLAMIVQSDGSLLITPNSEGEKKREVKVFEVGKTENSTHLYRSLIGAYIMGFSDFEIVSKSRIESNVRDSVIEFTQTVIGPEIIEEDIKSIKIKDLLNPSQMPFDSSFKRMYVLARTMIEDAVKALIDNNEELAYEVISRDRDLDRLQWLIARQTNMVLKDNALSKQMGVTLEKATFYFVVSRIIERIGDHAVRIASMSVNMDPTKLNSKVEKDIQKAASLAIKHFSDSISAWIKRDITAANDNLEEIPGLIKVCERINNAALKMDGEDSLTMGYIAESIRRIGEYSGDMSELIINYLMKE